MPETLHAREIVVPHVQLHQVSDQKQLFVRQETFSENMNLFQTSGFWPRVRARALRAPVF